jgi:hypothetical protein
MFNYNNKNNILKIQTPIDVSLNIISIIDPVLIETKVDIIIPEIKPTVPELINEIKQEQHDYIMPKQQDTLFWCIFIAANGYDEYIQVDRNYGIKELEIKKLVGDFIKENSSKFKSTNYKITKVSIQEILSDLLTSQKETNVFCLLAMIMFYNMNVIILDSDHPVILELLANKDNELPTFLLKKDSHNKYKINTTPLNNDQITELKQKNLSLESHIKPLKSLTMYKVEQLNDIAKTLGIYNENEKYKKNELYERIQEMIRWR